MHSQIKVWFIINSHWQWKIRRLVLLLCYILTIHLHFKAQTQNYYLKSLYLSVIGLVFIYVVVFLMLCSRYIYTINGAMWVVECLRSQNWMSELVHVQTRDNLLSLLIHCSKLWLESALAAHCGLYPLSDLLRQDFFVIHYRLLSWTSEIIDFFQAILLRAP